jgi:glycine cleavage system pyridoxal-binding protein P
MEIANASLLDESTAAAEQWRYYLTCDQETKKE